MAHRTEVPAVADPTVSPDPVGITHLLADLDARVDIHQKWRKLADAVRRERMDSLDAGRDQRAEALEWVLQEMGEGWEG